MERRVALGLSAAAAVWTAAIFFAPVAQARHLAGHFPQVVSAAGSFVCHQRAERSFLIAGEPMPVCARCTGLYLSGAIGALMAWLALPRTPRGTRAAILVAAAPTLATFAAEWAGLAEPGNLLRAVAALPLGAVCGWVFVRMLRAEAAPCVIIS
jgi:uncharacterized membrane protein